MLNGITVKVTAEARAQLEAVLADRNSPQKHVWRAHIVLLTADGCGTAEIMRGSGTSKNAVWRWQERFTTEGVAGLLRDKTRPSRIAPLGADVDARDGRRPYRTSRRARLHIGPPLPWPASKALA